MLIRGATYSNCFKLKPMIISDFFIFLWWEMKICKRISVIITSEITLVVFLVEIIYNFSLFFISPDVSLID